MIRLPRLALLLAIALLTSDCGNYEHQKQKLVRAVSAAVFQRVISVQQSIALTQTSVKEQPARTETEAKAAAKPVRTCHLRRSEVVSGSKAWLVALVRGLVCTIRKS